jgi:hypothetical protein
MCVLCNLCQNVYWFIPRFLAEVLTKNLQNFAPDNITALLTLLKHACYYIFVTPCHSFQKLCTFPHTHTLYFFLFRIFRTNNENFCDCLVSRFFAFWVWISPQATQSWMSWMSWMSCVIFWTLRGWESVLLNCVNRLCVFCRLETVFYVLLGWTLRIEGLNKLLRKKYRRPCILWGGKQSAVFVTRARRKAYVSFRNSSFFFYFFGSRSSVWENKSL